MTILDIIEDIESQGYTVLYAFKVGSSLYRTNKKSDIDYQVITWEDITVEPKQYDGKIDVWISSLNECIQTHPLVKANSLNGYNLQFEYSVDKRLDAFFQKNCEDLLRESLPTVYRQIVKTVKELSTINVDEYLVRKRYRSRMSDVIHSLFMLNNYYYGIESPFSLTDEQIRVLRNVRGKDDIQLSYDEALKIVGKLLSDEVRDFYRSLEYKCTVTNKFYDLIGDIMNNNSEINRMKFLFKLKQKQEPEKLTYFTDDDTNDIRIRFFDEMCGVLRLTFVDEDDYWAKIKQYKSIAGLDDYISNNFLVSFEKYLREEDLTSWNRVCMTILKHKCVYFQGSFGLALLRDTINKYVVMDKYPDKVQQLIDLVDSFDNIIDISF